jgi:hypothetical protein
MTTKLTLTIEDRVIKTAKKYALKNGKSLSGLIENYLKVLAAEDKSTDEMTQRIMRLRGSVKLPADFDYRKTLENSVAEKHGK